MKTFWAMLGALLLSILLLDLGMVYITFDKLSRVTEHSLDAALVAGIREEDARLGRLCVDPAEAQDAALKTLRDNLNLDGSLENRIMKDTVFTVTVLQDSSPAQAGPRPYVEGIVSTRVRVISPRLFGLEGIPVTVSRTQFHMSNYR